MKKESKEEVIVEQTTYTTSINCYNCGQHIISKIPKGTTVQAHFINKDCPNCGCTPISRWER